MAKWPERAEMDFSPIRPKRVIRRGDRMQVMQGTDILLNEDCPVLLAAIRDTADAILKDDAGEPR